MKLSNNELEVVYSKHGEFKIYNDSKTIFSMIRILEYFICIYVMLT